MPEGRFTDYLLNPEHPRNQGRSGRKTDGFAQLGYDLSEGEPGRAATRHIEQQLRQKLAESPTKVQRPTPWGGRFKTYTQIAGPNGRSGTAVGVWQIDNGATIPRLLTLWARVHKKGDNEER